MEYGCVFVTGTKRSSWHVVLAITNSPVSGTRRNLEDSISKDSTVRCVWCPLSDMDKVLRLRPRNYFAGLLIKAPMLPT